MSGRSTGSPILSRTRALSGKKTVDVSPETEKAWVKVCVDGAAGTLFARTDSWINGTNIPGKPRAAMFYMGGMANYMKELGQMRQIRIRGNWNRRLTEIARLSGTLWRATSASTDGGSLTMRALRGGFGKIRRRTGLPGAARGSGYRRSDGCLRSEDATRPSTVYGAPPRSLQVCSCSRRSAVETVCSTSRSSSRPRARTRKRTTSCA